MQHCILCVYSIAHHTSIGRSRLSCRDNKTRAEQAATNSYITFSLPQASCPAEEVARDYSAAPTLTEYEASF